MKTKLIIKSNNPDWAGEWMKNETESEMRDIGVSPDHLDWVEYVLDHTFDYLDKDPLNTDALAMVLSTWEGPVTLRDAQGDYAEIILN